MRKLNALLIITIATVSAAFAQENVAQQLGIDFKAIIIDGIAFLLMLQLLRITLFKGIGGMLAERRLDIQNTYDKIEADKLEMQRMKADYEARLESASAEGREKIQAAIKEAEGMKNQILEDARAQAEQIRVSNSQQIAQERQRVMLELRTQVADLALGAAEKLVGSSMDDARNRKLIDEFIDKVEVTA